MLHGLYVLTDSKYYSYHEWPERIEQIILAGANIIQLREKKLTEEQLLPLAQQIREICDYYNVLFIVNDYISLARKVLADGVHIGKHDHKLRHARDYLGKRYIIGVSCYNNLYSAICAQRLSADYVAFGSVFQSTTKSQAVHCQLSTITLAKGCLKIPICAIGGIKQQNAMHVVNAGADILATSDAVFNAYAPGIAAKKFLQQVIIPR